MERQIYDRIKSLEAEHWWFVARREILGAEIARLNLPAGADILEVGCGTGGNIPLLQRFGQVKAIEPDDEARLHAARSTGAAVERGFLPHDLPYAPASFDMVCAFDVVEHVEDDAGTVAALAAMAKPGGAVITTVPAYQWMWSRHDELHHHKRRYTLGPYRSLFERAGLTVQRASYFNTALFAPAAIRRLLKKALKIDGADDAMPSPAVNRLLTGVFASERGWLARGNFPFGVSILVVARRPGSVLILVSKDQPMDVDSGHAARLDLRCEDSPGWDILCAILAVFGAYCSLKTATGVFGIEPDTSHTLLLWYGFKQGGFGWLRDWNFTPDNWLLSLAPIHFAAFGLFGANFLVPILFGWVIFVAGALTAAAIAWSLGARRAAGPIAAILLNLGLLAHSSGFASYSTSHNITNLFGLLALLCLILWLRRANGLLLVASTLLLACGALSDPWMTATYMLPMGLAGVVLAAHPAFTVERGHSLTVLAVAAIAFVLFYSHLARAAFFCSKICVCRGHLQQFKENLGISAINIGKLLNCPFANGSAYYIYGLILSASLIFVYAILAGRFLSARNNADYPKFFFYSVSALSILGSVFGLATMSTPVNESGMRFFLNVPYLSVVTFCGFGSDLLGRVACSR